MDRENVIAAYGYLCARAARRFVRPGIDRADLEQVAAIGLLKACDRYDPALRTPFEAYAWCFILGELMHHVRDCEPMVRPPRELRSLERRWQSAYDDLLARLGREPGCGELAGYLGVDRAALEELRLYRARSTTHSLGDVTAQKLRASWCTIEDRDDLLAIEHALERLTPTERTIVLALHAVGYSQVEVARKMGYSKRHISRLHRAALKKMQPALQVLNP